MTYRQRGQIFIIDKPVGPVISDKEPVFGYRFWVIGLSFWIPHQVRNDRGIVVGLVRALRQAQDKQVRNDSRRGV